MTTMPEKREKRAKTVRVAVYIVLRLLVIFIMILQIIRHDWNNVFMCLLTLFLFMLPAMVERRLKIDLPNALEIVVLLFIFAAEILGEIGEFYLRVPRWDSMLHTINGFLMAAIGFALIDILNQSPKFHISLSPVFVAFVAFCFSMTIGVLWEFFEFGVDRLFHTDMQKDFVLSSISSINLNPEGVNSAVTVSGIPGVTISGMINGAPGEAVIEGGYLDVGLYDTMKDMFVNLIGAVVFSVIGAVYIKGRGKGRMAGAFIPRMLTKEEIAGEREESERRRLRRRRRIKR